MEYIAIMMLVFLVLLVLRVPVAHSIGFASFALLFYLSKNPTTAVNTMFSSVNSYSLLAVPLFMLLGSLMNHGGITDRLEEFCHAAIGHVRGGLGYINVLDSMLFAGLSGSATADVAGLGAIMIPTMKKSGYDDGYTVAITCCTACLGVIIPPSTLMVVYSAAAGLSVGALFAAGVIPGLVIGIAQMIYTYFRAKKYNYPVSPASSFKQFIHASIKAVPVLVIPLIIMGGTTTGLFTATESAAVACVFALFLCFFVLRSFNLKDLPMLLAKTAEDVSLSMLAVGTGGIMGWLIAYLGASDAIVAAILGVSSSPIWIFACLTVFLLVIGTFMSPMTAILVFMPIFQGLSAAAGINAVHMAIVVILLLSLGMVTPPYGSCLLLASRIANVKLGVGCKAVLPIIAVTVMAIWVGILFPDLFLLLPKLLMPTSFS